MNLLLDQGLPRGAVALLCRSGHDAVHTGDVGLAQSEDAEILEWARIENRIVVTLDADFHALMTVSGAASPSVIRIRIEGLNSDSLAGLLSGVLRSFESDLLRGVLMTIQPKRVRMRSLPLTGQ